MTSKLLNSTRTDEPRPGWAIPPFAPETIGPGRDVTACSSESLCCRSRGSLVPISGTGGPNDNDLPVHPCEVFVSFLHEPDAGTTKLSSRKVHVERHRSACDSGNRVGSDGTVGRGVPCTVDGRGRGRRCRLRRRALSFGAKPTIGSAGRWCRRPEEADAAGDLEAIRLPGDDVGAHTLRIRVRGGTSACWSRACYRGVGRRRFREGGIRCQGINRMAVSPR